VTWQTTVLGLLLWAWVDATRATTALVVVG
jgi:hypothetical protein